VRPIGLDTIALTRQEKHSADKVVIQGMLNPATK
jgi:hypothetical protein